MKSASSTSYAIPYNFFKMQLWRWLLWFGVMAILITASLLNYPPLHFLLQPPHDKVLHIVVFFGFLIFTKLLIKNFSLLKVCLITFGLSLLIELLQKFFTHGLRQFDKFDILFNLIGIALGLVILLIYRGVENGKAENKV